MLITTHTGIVVNSDHVAYIPLKKQETEEREAQASPEPASRFKVLLCFATADSVVAAAGLTQEAAEFVRKDIAHSWAEGLASFDVHASLRRHQEGAYFASEGAENAEKESR